MDILLDWDRRLLLTLNGSDSPFWDSVMMSITQTVVWIPLALALLYIMAKNVNLRQLILFVLMMAVLILITDRVSSGLVKPFVHRFRPTHEPGLADLVDVCRGYRGGLYGFFSSHAANTFGLSIFASMVIRSTKSTVTLVSWALLSSYSRIYLGVHYPGDILCGALFGMAVGVVLYRLYSCLLRKIGEPAQTLSPERTATGILKRDIIWLPMVFIITLMVIGIYALL